MDLELIMKDSRISIYMKVTEIDGLLTKGSLPVLTKPKSMY